MKSLRNTIMIALLVIALSGCGQTVTLDEIRAKNTLISLEYTEATKTVSIFISSPDPVTTVQTEIGFDPAFVGVSEIDAGDSPFNIRLKQEISSDMVSISAASLKPGQTGKVRLADMVIESLKPGKTTFTINKSGSRLLNGESEWGFETHDLELTLE